MLNLFIMFIKSFFNYFRLVLLLLLGVYQLLIPLTANAVVSAKYEVKAVSYQYRIVTVGEVLRLNLIGTVYLADPAVRYQIKHENWIIPSSDWRVVSGAAKCTSDGNLKIEGAGLIEVEGKGPNDIVYKAKIFATPRFLTKYVLDLPPTLELGKDYKVRLLIADAITNAYELPADFYELKFTGIEGNVLYNPINHTIRAIKTGDFIIKVVNNSYTTVPNPQNLIVVPIKINPGPISMGNLKGRISWRTAREDWFPLPFTRIKLALPSSLFWFDSGIKASNQDGYFDFGQVPAGKYRIIAETSIKDNPVFWIQDVEVKPGQTTDVRLSYMNPISPQELANEYRRVQGDNPQIHKFPDKPGSFGPEYIVSVNNNLLSIEINGNMQLTNRKEIQRTFKNIIESSNGDVILDLSNVQNFVREYLLDLHSFIPTDKKVYVLGVSSEYFKGLGLTKSIQLPDNIVFIPNKEYVKDTLGFNWENPDNGILSFLDNPYEPKESTITQENLNTSDSESSNENTLVEIIVEPEQSS